MKYLIIFFLLTGVTSFSQTSYFNHEIFNDLLVDAVNDDRSVDYQFFAKNKKFDDYIKSIGKANISKFSKEEKLAFYINSYNALVIKNVLNHFPIKSPMDVEGFFKKYKFKVAGDSLSLDELEYERVLKIEPLLSHFGLVCAAKSCPPLIPKAYTSENIYSQLEVNMQSYLRDTSQNYLNKENKTLYLSQIFKWFRDSFEKKYGSLQKMASSYLNNSDAAFISNNDVKINFLNYNWELNSQ
jgi:hypothetical protein